MYSHIDMPDILDIDSSSIEWGFLADLVCEHTYYIYIYICICIYTYMYISIYMHMYIYTYIHVFTYVDMPDIPDIDSSSIEWGFLADLVCEHTYYIYVYMYIYKYVYLYIYTCIFIY